MTTLSVHPLHAPEDAAARPDAAETPTPAVHAAPVANQRRIFLRGLVLDAQIGVYEHEMGRTQRVNVDVDVYLTSPTGPIDDELANVLDYDFIRHEAHALIENRHIKLQETLAEALAEACLAQPGVTAVRVATSKLDIYDDCHSVGYETVRVN